MVEELKISPEFEMLIPSLTNDEYEQLERNILTEGEIFTPIFTWNGYIIDGHHRYQILCNHADEDIKFHVAEKAFNDKYEAMSWICNNQLGRRNLTPANKKYLIGKRYAAEKKSNGASDGFRGNQYVRPVQDKSCQVASSTRQRIAKEANVSEGYVMYADQFAKGVDAAEEVMPGIKKEILSGEIKRSVAEISRIAKVPFEDREELCSEIRMPRPSYKKPSREMSAMIGTIGAQMRSKKPPTDNESALMTLNGAVTLMMESFEVQFDGFPDLLSKEECFGEVRNAMQRKNEYFSELEERHKEAVQ